MIATEPKTYCARHPREETNLRCASCGTFICPKCLVQTPVGSKCKECASQRGAVLFTPSPLQVLAATLVGILTGAFAGWAVEFSVGYLTLLLAVAYGGFAAEMILRASGRKRGLKMEIIAGVSMTVGAIGGRLLMAAIQLGAAGQVRPPFGIFDVLADLIFIPLVALIIVIGTVISRIRYL